MNTMLLTSSTVMIWYQAAFTITQRGRTTQPKSLCINIHTSVLKTNSVSARGTLEVPSQLTFSPTIQCSHRLMTVLPLTSEQSYGCLRVCHFALRASCRNLCYAGRSLVYLVPRTLRDTGQLRDSYSVVNWLKLDEAQLLKDEVE